MKLNDSFEVWLTANCPHAQVREDALRHVDEAMRRGVGCSFVFGGRLTKSGRATLVHGYCGQLFGFLLTAEQASAYGAGDDALIAAFGATLQSHTTVDDPPIAIESVELDSGGAIDPALPIRGTLKLSTLQWWLVPLAIRAVLEPPGRSSVVLQHHLESLPRGEHHIRFEFLPLGISPVRESDARSRPSPAFVQLFAGCEPPRAETATTPPFDRTDDGPADRSTSPMSASTLAISFLPGLVTPETLHALCGRSDAAVSMPGAAPSLPVSDIRAVLAHVASG